MLSSAQAQFMDHFYWGLSGGLHRDKSTAHTSYTGWVGSQDINTFGLAKEGTIDIGFEFNSRFFAESGFGYYETVHTYSLNDFVWGDYEKVKVRQGWYAIPIMLGIKFPVSKKLDFSALLGVNMLIDRIPSKNKQYGYFNMEQKKSGKPLYDSIQNATAFIRSNDIEFFALFGKMSLRLNYNVNRYLRISSELGFNLSMRPIESKFFILEEEWDGHTNFGKVVSTLAGDNIGLKLGVAYSWGGFKR